MVKNKFTILGSGTSTGVPTIGCNCETCLSDDIRDKRLRCSLLVESDDTVVVIDTSSDFRMQMLQHKVNKIDAVVYTHHHFDHIGGFDDIRSYNFTMNKPIDIFGTENTISHIQRIYSYAFSEPQQSGGGVPEINVNFIDSTPFKIKNLEFIPIPMMHGKLEVLGFRIGDFAYCTDTNYISENALKLLTNLEILVIDGLRHHKHSTHFSVNEAIEISRLIKPRKTYLTHISHYLRHAQTEKNLPENIFLAYDGIKFEV